MTHHSWLAVEARAAPVRPGRGPPKRWQRGKLLGSGAFGQVSSAMAARSLVSVPPLSCAIICNPKHGVSTDRQVYLALDMDTGAEIAIKQVQINAESGDSNVKVCHVLLYFYFLVSLLSYFLSFSFSFSFLYLSACLDDLLTKQEMQALESEIALLRNLRHEVT